LAQIYKISVLQTAVNDKLLFISLLQPVIATTGTDNLDLFSLTILYKNDGCYNIRNKGHSLWGLCVFLLYGFFFNLKVFPTFETYCCPSIGFMADFLLSVENLFPTHT